MVPISRYRMQQLKCFIKVSNRSEEKIFSSKVSKTTDLVLSSWWWEWWDSSSRSSCCWGRWSNFSSWRTILGGESSLEFISDVIEQRVNADEQISVEETVEKSANDSSACKSQDIDEGADGGDCEQNHHRLDFEVVALRMENFKVIYFIEKTEFLPSMFPKHTSNRCMQNQ